MRPVPPDPKLARGRDVSTQFEELSLPTARAGDDEARFAGGFIKGAGQTETVGAALEALGVEASKGALCRGAGRFVVLAADEVASGIHGRSLRCPVGHPLAGCASWSQRGKIAPSAGKENSEVGGVKAPMGCLEEAEIQKRLGSAVTTAHNRVSVVTNGTVGTGRGRENEVLPLSKK